MSDTKDIRIGELEAALRPFINVAVACMNSYDQRDDLVIWRPPVTRRSSAVVTRADVIRAKELLGPVFDS